jgi:hypothetical protein
VVHVIMDWEKEVLEILYYGANKAE